MQVEEPIIKTQKRFKKYCEAPKKTSGGVFFNQATSPKPPATLLRNDFLRNFPGVVRHFSNRSFVNHL